MSQRSEEIFGNEMSRKVVRKAERSKESLVKKFGDDSEVDYQAYTEENPYIGELLGVRNIKIEAPKAGEEAEASKSDAAEEEKLPAAVPDQEREVVRSAADFRRASSSGTSAWDSGITGSPWPSLPRPMPWVIHPTGWT